MSGVALCLPSQMAARGVAILLACLGCLWLLRCMAEASQPWLGGAAPQAAAGAAALLTLLPASLYLWAAHALWAAANELCPTGARRTKTLQWLAAAAALARLAAANYAELDAPAFERHVLAVLTGAVALGTLGVGAAAHWIIDDFENECHDPALACLV